MKFGAYLEARLRPEWRSKYINYKKLKAMIKALSEVENTAVDVPTGNSGAGERVTSLSTVPTAPTNVAGKFNGQNITEADFFQFLEEEMKKIDDFTGTQMLELKQRVENISTKVAELSEAELSALTADQRKDLIREAKKLGEEFLILEKYVNLNYLGFHKILKKHDKQLPIPCQRFYMTRLHTQKWIKHDYSKLFVVLSTIHAKLRGDKSAENENLSGQSFVRSTTKYWVRTGDISKVKHLILQQLPVFQHKLDTLEGDSQLTNSVYFDNAQLELYHGRLDKLPNAIAIRFRWYESEKPQLVFVERKTHFDSWTGDESVKERFTLKESQVLPFLKGSYTVNDKLNEMKDQGKSEKDMENVKKLFSEIYKQIDSKQLRPTLRTQYMRVAYQIPFDPRVRISLDTNLCMIAENPQTGVDCTTAGRWYRDPDIPLPPTEYTLFPHAILEVKLSLKKDEPIPTWVGELTSEETGLVTRVHKFSKFIHGCATLLSKSVQAVPYWVDDESIRTSMLRALPKEKRRSRARLLGAVGKEKKDDKDRRAEPLLGFGEREGFRLMQRSGSLGRDFGSFYEDNLSTIHEEEEKGEMKLKISEMNKVRNEEMQAAAKQKGNHLRQRHSKSKQENASDDDIEDQEHGYFEQSNSLRLGWTHSLYESIMNKLFRSRSHQGYVQIGEDENVDANQGYSERNRHAYKIRKTPMRIEPKVFFANERTFLSWVHMSITLGSISAVLLGFSSKDVNAGAAGDVITTEVSRSARYMRLVGLVLLPVSILFICYALGIFYWRGKNIRSRIDSDFYHDPVGPLLLGLVLLTALVSIFVLFIFNQSIPKF